MFNKIERKADATSHESLFNACIVDGVFGSALFDNIKAVFPCDHKVLGELLAYTDDEGKPKSRTSIEVPNKYFNTAVKVRSSLDGSEITIDGSYVKWLTGQNIVGTQNLLALCNLMYEKVCAQLGIKPTQENLNAVKEGGFRLLRVDYTVHCDAGSEEKAVFLQEAIKRCWAFSRSDYSHYRYLETLYVGQHSHRQTFKTYLKGREVSKDMKNEVPFSSQLLAISKRLVRIEMTLKSKFLREQNLTSPLDWTEKNARRFMKDEIRKYLSRIIRKRPDTSKLSKLNCRQKLVVAASTANIDILGVFDRRAYRRLRDGIFSKSGIDIALPSAEMQLVPRFVTARSLIKNKVKYRSRRKLFEYLVNFEPEDKSDISDLIQGGAKPGLPHSECITHGRITKIETMP